MSGKDKVTTVRVGSYRAEHRPRSACVMGGLDHPDRVDVWRGVQWVGQWLWIPETGLASVRSRSRPMPEVDDVTLGRIAHALRERGV